MGLYIYTYLLTFEVMQAGTLYYRKMYGKIFYLMTYISAMISKSILRGTGYTFIAEKMCIMGI